MKCKITKPDLTTEERLLLCAVCEWQNCFNNKELYFGEVGEALASAPGLGYFVKLDDCEMWFPECVIEFLK